MIPASRRYHSAWPCSINFFRAHRCCWTLLLITWWFAIIWLILLGISISSLWYFSIRRFAFTSRFDYWFWCHLHFWFRLISYPRSLRFLFIYFIADFDTDFAASRAAAAAAHAALGAREWQEASRARAAAPLPLLLLQPLQASSTARAGRARRAAAVAAVAARLPARVPPARKCPASRAAAAAAAAHFISPEGAEIYRRLRGFGRYAGCRCQHLVGLGAATGIAIERYSRLWVSILLRLCDDAFDFEWDYLAWDLLALWLTASRLPSSPAQIATLFLSLLPGLRRFALIFDWGIRFHQSRIFSREFRWRWRSISTHSHSKLATWFLASDEPSIDYSD